MLDIHAHLLPGMDDGAASYIESCFMIKQAYESGVKAIVATPHFNYYNQQESCYMEEYNYRFNELKRYIKEQNIPLDLYQGMEIFANKNIPELIQNHKLLTINNSKYVLIEFAFDESPAYANIIIEKIIKLNIIPVIAHPERYEFIQKDRYIATDMIESGCIFQLNKGSILGEFGYNAKKLSKYLLSNGLCHVIASDAHSPYQRTAYMLDIYEYICDYYSVEYAELLLSENPFKIVNNKNLFTEELI